MTCASSSFSPLAGIGVASAGIFLADEGLDVGVAILGVVELDLDAPEAGTRGVLLGDTQSFPDRELHNAYSQSWEGLNEPSSRGAHLQWGSWLHGGTSSAG